MLCNLSKLNILTPSGNILDSSRWKAFADDTINVTEKMKFVLGRVGNTVGYKRENAGLQAFSSFPTTFSTQSKTEIIISATSFCRLQMLSISLRPKFCHLVKSSPFTSYANFWLF